MKKGVSCAILILIGGASLWMLFLRFEHSSKVGIALSAANTEHYDGVLSGANTPIYITIADTVAARAQGLSGTVSLAKTAGKLFMFDTPGKYGFWMKDMQYGLDMVWIDKDFRVVATTSNVAPDTYPRVFYPPQEVLSVLEINANSAAVLGIHTGGVLTLQRGPHRDQNNISF